MARAMIEDITATVLSSGITPESDEYSDKFFEAFFDNIENFNHQDLREMMDDFPEFPIGPLEIVNPAFWDSNKEDFFDYLMSNLDDAKKAQDIRQAQKVLEDALTRKMNVSSSKAKFIAQKMFEEIQNSIPNFDPKDSAQVDQYFEKLFSVLGEFSPDMAERYLADLPLMPREEVNIVNPVFWEERKEAIQTDLLGHFDKLKGKRIDILGDDILQTLSLNLNIDRAMAGHIANKIMAQVASSLEGLDPDSDEYRDRYLDALYNRFVNLAPTEIDELLKDYDATLRPVVDNDFWEANFEPVVEDCHQVIKIAQENGSIDQLKQGMVRILGARLNWDEQTSKIVVHGLLKDVEGALQDVDRESPDYQSKYFQMANKLIENLSPDAVNDTFFIKGSKEEISDFFTVKDHGIDPMAMRGAWKVKSPAFAQEVEKCLETVRVRGGGVQELEQAVWEVVHKELDVSPEQAKTVVKGIMDNATEMLGNDYFKGKVSAVIDEVGDKLEDLRYEDKLEKKDQQIKRMKDLIDSMKAELMAHKEVERIVKTVAPEEKNDLLGGHMKGAVQPAFDEEQFENVAMIGKLQRDLESMKNAVKKAQKDLIKKDMYQKKLKEEGKQQDLRRINQIQILEERVGQLVNQAISDKEGREEKDELVRLRNENKSLVGMIEVANKRIANLTTNADKTKNDAQRKTQFEMERLKESYKNSLDKMTKYRAENHQLTGKLKGIEAEFKAIKSRFVKEQERGAQQKGADHEELLEKNKEVNKLKLELSAANNKTKGLELKVKELAQKMKFLSAQAQSAEEHRERPKGDADYVSKSSEEKLEHKVKQLELMNNKLTTVSRKAADDLNEKKKEAMKYKAEVTALKHQVATLERKLANKKS